MSSCFVLFLHFSLFCHSLCSRDALKSICLDVRRFTRLFETNTWPLWKQFWEERERERRQKKRDRNRYSFLNPSLRSRWKCIRQLYDGQIRTNSLGCRKCRVSGPSPSPFRIFTSHTNGLTCPYQPVIRLLRFWNKFRCKTVWDRRSR